MKHQTVSVQIESILQTSPKSYEVRWSETARDLSGAPAGVTHLEAMLETEMPDCPRRFRAASNAKRASRGTTAWAVRRTKAAVRPQRSRSRASALA